MTEQEIKALKNGVYRIYWNECDGYSVASIGRFPDGSCWLAPSNWISLPTGSSRGGWSEVHHVELIETQGQVEVIDEEENCVETSHSEKMLEAIASGVSAINVTMRSSQEEKLENLAGMAAAVAQHLDNINTTLRRMIGVLVDLDKTMDLISNRMPRGGE